MIFQYVWIGILILAWAIWTICMIYDVYNEYKRCDNILEAIKESIIAGSWIIMHVVAVFIFSLAVYLSNRAG